MSRLVSFVVLVAVILVVAVLFFRVMAEFVVPMFLAAVLVVVFRPLHKWFQFKLAGHPRLAALCTTVCIVLIVLLPSAGIAWKAYLEVANFTKQALEGDPAGLEKRIEAVIRSVAEPLEETYHIGLPEAEDIRRSIDQMMRDWAGESGGTAAIGTAAFAGAQWLLMSLFRLIVGLVIMIISVYFFLADGPGMIVAIMHLSPLDDRYEMELLNKFSNISRSVVVATLLSAFVQGVLGGIGYFVVGIETVFTLTGLTMVLAMVPFFGAAAVWVPTCVWLWLADARPGAAIGLALYGAAVVSTIDNVIKPFVLHGQSNLHPLLALLSVLGGVAAMGPIGILVGPMAVAFLQALLGMLRREIEDLGENGGTTGPIPPPAVVGGELAETAVDHDTSGADAAAAAPTPTPIKNGNHGNPQSASQKDRSTGKRSKFSRSRRKRS